MSNRKKLNSNGVPFVKKDEWDQIRFGRVQREADRQIRNQRLNRDTTPMPGYPNLLMPL